jgi:hypothetical protein
MELSSEIKIKLAQCYLDSDKISEQLLVDLLYTAKPHAAAFTSSTESEITLRSFQDASLVLTQLESKLSLLCDQLDRAHYIPILVATCNRFYIANTIHSNQILGVAIKTCIAVLWTNQGRGKEPGKRDYDILKKAVEVAMALSVVNSIAMMWEFDPRVEVTITPESFAGNRFFWQFYTDGITHGRLEYKTLEVALGTVWNDALRFKAKLEVVLGNPSNLPPRIFGDTFLSEIPYSYREFWIYLWTAFHLLGQGYYLHHQINGGVELKNILFIDRNSIGEFFERLPPEAHEAAKKLFWETGWHLEWLTKNKREWHQMIIDRPIVSNDDDNEIFATSEMFLQNAIVNKLEQYIHSDEGKGIYERFYSGPFEKKIIDLFRQHGFEAGEVSKKGAWKLLAGPLLVRSSETMPGQIDLLAIVPLEKVIVIADCKMFKSSNSRTVLRNRLDKVGDKDSEGFHKNLEKKVNWFYHSELYKQDHSDYTVLPMLITSQFVPFTVIGAKLVYYKEHIVECLQNSIPVTYWKDFLKGKLYG